LAISLRVLYRTRDMFNIELLIKFNKSLIDELSVVVGDDDMGYPKTKHNIIPHKILNISCCDCCQEFDLYSLGKVIYSN